MSRHAVERRLFKRGHICCSIYNLGAGVFARVSHSHGYQRLCEVGDGRENAEKDGNASVVIGFVGNPPPERCSQYSTNQTETAYDACLEGIESYVDIEEDEVGFVSSVFGILE